MKKINKNINKNIIMSCMVAVLLCMVPAVMAQTDVSDVVALSVTLLSQDPDPASSGELVEMRIGIENLGGTTAEDVIVEIVPEYPFSIVSGQVQKVGTLKGGENNMVVLKFTALIDKDATEGSYDLKVNYYQEGQDKIQAKLSVDVDSTEIAEIIHIDKTVLVPGKEDTLQFVINNVGSAPLRDLQFTWVNEDKIILPVGSDNTKYIRNIDVGESATLTYTVISDSNADPGLYELELSLSYADGSGSSSTTTSIAGVYVGGGTDFDVAFSETSDSETSFSIANIGSNPAYSVSVIIPEQDSWTTSGSSSVIIGNLNQGDYTVASFTLQQKSSSQRFNQGGSAGTSTTQNAAAASNTRSASDALASSDTQAMTARSSTSSPVKIQVAYTDTRGERLVVEKEVVVNQATSTTSYTSTAAATGDFTRMRGQQQSTFSKYKWYFIGLIVVVVGLSGYLWYRKKKLLDPNFKVRNLRK